MMMCSCYTCSDITKYSPLRCLSQLYKPIQLSSETHYDYKFKMVTTTGTFIVVVAVIFVVAEDWHVARKMLVLGACSDGEIIPGYV